MAKRKRLQLNLIMIKVIKFGEDWLNSFLCNFKSFIMTQKRTCDMVRWVELNSIVVNFWIV